MANTAVYDSENESLLNQAVEDDSDNDSLVHLDAPADGYFEQRDIPQQTYVQNTSQQQSAKAREAATEQAQSQLEQQQHHTTSQFQSSSQQISSTRWANEAGQLLDPEQAPPDYESATAGQRQQQREAFDSQHPLVRNGLLHDPGVFNARAQPQSMRDPLATQQAVAESSANLPTSAVVNERDYAEVEAQQQQQPSTEQTPLLARGTQGGKKHRRRRRFCTWKSCMFGTGVVLLALLAIIAVAIYNNQRHGNKEKESNPNVPHKDGFTPAHPSSLGRCKLNSFSKTASFGFDKLDEKFEFLEFIDAAQYGKLFPEGVQMAGTVQILPASAAQEAGGPEVKVSVNIATNSPLSITKFKYNQARDSLELFFPEVKHNGWSVGEEACFDIAVAIRVRKGTRVKGWRTSTAHMSVLVEEGLFEADPPLSVTAREGLVVSHQTLLSAVAGEVSVAYWDSRRTVIETRSGRIEGNFALRDLLSLSSASGAIEVDVDPQEEDEEDPAPAEFVMTSISGRVSAEFPTSYGYNIPERVYSTQVKTKSGRIAGSYIFGDEASFSTLSGHVEIDVLPYYANTPTSSPSALPGLFTETGSGRTELTLLEPYLVDFDDFAAEKDRRGVLDGLKSQHQSASGAIILEYPQAWEGTIDAKSVTGAIELYGKDVEYWDAEIPLVGKHVVGRKGRGDSEVKIRTMTGRIEALIGDA